MRANVGKPLIDTVDITEIELLILRRMREVATGEHASMLRGTGFDFVALRDCQPGDRLASIDWAQSTFTNFAPLVVREFEQPSNAAVIVVADRSASTRCGVGGTSIGAIMARALATIGLSAAFFQDPFGLMTVEGPFRRLATVHPRIGRAHVIHCLEAYQHGTAAPVTMRRNADVFEQIDGCLRNPCLVPVISDFLFDGIDDTLTGLGRLGTRHDVFLVLVDSAFAFELPEAPAGWIDAYDVETGRSAVVSRGELRQLASRVRIWQGEVAQLARSHNLDVLRLGAQPDQNLHALVEFVMDRRRRRV